MIVTSGVTDDIVTASLIPLAITKSAVNYSSRKPGWPSQIPFFIDIFFQVWFDGNGYQALTDLYWRIRFRSYAELGLHFLPS